MSTYPGNYPAPGSEYMKAGSPRFLRHIGSRVTRMNLDRLYSAQTRNIISTGSTNVIRLIGGWGEISRSAVVSIIQNNSGPRTESTRP